MRDRRRRRRRRRLGANADASSSTERTSSVFRRDMCFPPAAMIEAASAARHAHAVPQARPHVRTVNLKVKPAPSQRIRSLLVANRGEIAIRVMRAASELGLRTVAIYSQEDRFSLHRTKADEAYLVGRGQGPGRGLPRHRGHPAHRARGAAWMPSIPATASSPRTPSSRAACAAAGIIFIGPKPETMRVLGNKVAARKLAVAAGRAGDAGDARRCRADLDACARAGRRDRLPGDAQGELGRRRARHARGGERGAAARSCCRWRGARRRPPSATTRSTSRSWCGARATSRCRSSATSTATWCTCSSATAPCSGATRRWSSAPRRCSSTRRSARELCAAALAIGARRATTATPARSSSCRTPTAGEFYFIEVNPRIQVEHTVTECVTGIDLVKAQIRIAERRAHRHARERRAARRSEIRISAHALQCRITTEDPENNFIPDYGRITAYRSPAGFGIRLDAGTAYTGAIITRSYDSLLVKVTAWAPTPEETIARMHRALWEFRIRGVVTNLRFLDQLITHPRFAQRRLHHALHRRDAGAVPVAAQARPRHAASSPSSATIIVNGNPETPRPRRGRRSFARRAAAAAAARRAPRAGHASRSSTSSAPERFAQWMLARAARAAHRHHHARRAPVAARHAHAHARHDGDRAVLRAPAAAAVLGGVLGRGDLRRRACASCARTRGQRLAQLRERMPNLLLQMLLRSANAVGYTNYPDNVVRFFVRAGRGRRHRPVPHLRLAQLGREHARRDRRGARERQAVRGGDLLHRQPERPAREEVHLDYYLRLARELKAAGAHILGIKDMAGLCRPRAAYALVKALKERSACRSTSTPTTPAASPPPACWRRSTPAPMPSTGRSTP